MCVHSFLGVRWEAEPCGLGLGILRETCCGWVLTTMGSCRVEPANLAEAGSSESLCVTALRGRPTGSFGEVTAIISCNRDFRAGEVFAGLSVNIFFRGRPWPRAGDVCAVRSSEASFRGRPLPRAGEVGAGNSSRGFFRGLPRPRLGETIVCTTSSISTRMGCLRDLSLSAAETVVEKSRTGDWASVLERSSGPASGMLASNARNTVLLAGDVAKPAGRSGGGQLAACGKHTESSLWRSIQSSPLGSTFVSRVVD
jgi:hypothetical protein